MAVLNRRLLNRTQEIVLALPIAALVLAAAALAVAQVPDDDYLLTDEKSDRTRASLDIEGQDYGVEVRANCGAFDDDSDSPETGSLLQVSSEHPDGATLRKQRGELEQAQKDNGPMVELVTGSGDGQIHNFLLCEKAEVEGEVKTKKSPNQGSFEASGKNCVCVDDGEFDSDDCSVFTAQVNRLDTDCLNDKTLSLTFEDGELTRFKIKGKGRAFRVDDTP